MDYYFKRDFYNEDDIEKEKSNMRELLNQELDIKKERERKEANKRNCIKRTMGFYNTTKRAMVNQQKLDKFMVIGRPAKRRRLSIVSEVNNMDLNERSSKEEMNASDDEDDDILN